MKLISLKFICLILLMCLLLQQVQPKRFARRGGNVNMARMGGVSQGIAKGLQQWLYGDGESKEDGQGNRNSGSKKGSSSSRSEQDDDSLMTLMMILLVGGAMGFIYILNNDKQRRADQEIARKIVQANVYKHQNANEDRRFDMIKFTAKHGVHPERNNKFRLHMTQNPKLKKK